MKKYADSLGLFVMFVGLHFYPGSYLTWWHLLAVGLVLTGLNIGRWYQEPEDKVEYGPDSARQGTHRQFDV